MTAQRPALADVLRMTFRPHPLWLAWAALGVAAKRLRLALWGRP